MYKFPATDLHLNIVDVAWAKRPDARAQDFAPGRLGFQLILNAVARDEDGLFEQWVLGMQKASLDAWAGPSNGGRDMSPTERKTAIRTIAWKNSWREMKWRRLNLSISSVAPSTASTCLKMTS